MKINHRRIEGWGLGIRSSGPSWQLDLAIAQRPGGWRSTAEPGASTVRLWVVAGYRF